MCVFRARHSPQDKPSPSLDIEMKAEQVSIIAPTIQDLMIKLAQRKLSNVDAINSHCGMQNNPERIKKLLSALELTASLAEISALSKANKAKGKCTADTKLMDSAPPALAKLNKYAGTMA
jgi:hypothetical protein